MADANILKVVPSPALILRSNIYTFPCYKLKRVLGRQTDNDDIKSYAEYMQN